MKHHIIACALIIIFPAYSAHLTDKKDDKTQTQTIGLRFYERIKQYRCPNSYPKEELPASFESEFKELIAAFKKEGQDINGNYFHERLYENLFDTDAGTPLTMALKAKLSDNLIQELIKAGADVNKKDMHNSPPLVLAAHTDREETVKTLLENGAFPNVRDRDVPLLHVCSPKIGQLLLEHGANVNARNKSNKRTALHEAVNPPPHYLGNYNYSFLDILLKHHPDVNAKDISGYTPFHYLVYDIPFIPLSESSKSKILRAMKALISAGAYLSEKNNYGNSCIEILKHYPSSTRAQFLSDLAAWMQDEKKQKPSFTAFMNRALNGKLIWSFTDKHKKVHTTPPPALPLEIIYKVFNHMHYSWNLTDHIIDHKEEEEENILNNYLEFMQAIEEEQIAFESFADFRALLEQ